MLNSAATMHSFNLLLVVLLHQYALLQLWVEGNNLHVALTVTANR